MKPYFQFGEVYVSTFLLFNSFGFVFGILFFKYRAKRFNLKEDHFVNISLILFVMSFIGSKLYYYFEYPEDFSGKFFEVFFSFGGFGWYGGFLAVLVSTLLYTYYHKLDFVNILNIIAPSIPLGIIFGRFACFMAGDACYGTPTDLPWGMSFPDGAIPTVLHVHPTPLYEMLGNGIILPVLLASEKQFKVNIFFLYLILASILRFSVEFIRLNQISLLGLTTPQLYCIVFFTIGLCSIFFRSTAPILTKRPNN